MSLTALAVLTALSPLAQAGTAQTDARTGARTAVAAVSPTALSSGAPSHAHTEDHADIRPAASLKFESGFADPPASTWPADAPPVRFYFAPGASAPSCGLLVASNRQVLPLVEPDEGSSFPQCVGVPAAMVLQQGSQRFLLLRIQQQDTREDRSLNDLLLLERGGVPQLRDDLATTSAPDSSKPLTQVAAWLRARWALQTDADQGARPLPEHTAVTPGAYLAVSQKAAGACQFSAGTPDRPAPLLQVAHPCERVAATSGFQQGEESWFVVLLGGGSGVGGVGRGQALVFVVDAKGGREQPELAAELQPKAAEGKILPLRQALQKRVTKPKS